MTKEKKEEIMAKFKSALYARDVDSFQVANENFLKSCSNIEVRTNEKYLKLDAYFNTYPPGIIFSYVVWWILDKY